MEKSYPSPIELKELLKQEGVALKKKWGQHFLIPDKYRREIVERAGAGKQDFVWEIGPGAGSLTTYLLERCRRLVCFELDHGLIRVLKKVLGTGEGEKGLRIVPGDFCKTWREEGEKHGFPHILVGNLPYASGSTMVVDLIKAGTTSQKMVVMVQKEVGERMAASPGDKAYSAFSLICQSAYSVQPVLKVPSHAFFPRPEVESIVLELAPHGGYERITNRDLFFYLVDGLFHGRRKKAVNSLLTYGSTFSSSSLSTKWERQRRLTELPRRDMEESFEEAGITPGARGETLGIDEVISLTEALFRRISKE